MNPYPHVFSPLTIRGKTYKNRLIAAPTMFAHSIFTIPEMKENVYRMVEDRAKGGFACVSTGEHPVNAEEGTALFYVHPMDFTKYEGPDFEAMKEYADRIKKHGALCYLEFCHEGARAEHNPPYSPWGPDAYVREDGVEDIFFRYEDTMTHYSVDKMADAAGEDADVELKQNREDISLRLDGETRDDLSERYQEWVPVQTPEPQERLILTHKEVEQKTSEELRRELDELRKQELEMGFQFAKKRDDLPSLDWWLEPARAETVKQKTSEELRRELDESLKQLAARFEDIAPEEDKKPLLVLVEPSGTERKKYIDPLESDLRRYTDLSDDWDDLPDTQGEIKLWIPEDLEKAKLWIPEDLGHLISPSKESLSGIDGIA